VGMEILEGKGYSSSLFITGYISQNQIANTPKLEKILNYNYLAEQQFGYTFSVNCYIFFSLHGEPA
jgi:hypothetical protein